MPMNKKILLRDSGFVLIVSLFILSFLSVVAITLAHYGHLAMTLTARYKQQYRSAFLARGMTQKIIASAWEDKTGNDFDDLGENWVLEYMPQGESRELTVTGFDGRAAGRYRALITDEAGKLNLNTASTDELKALFLQFGVTNAEPLARLVDETRRQKPFVAVREILSVRGMPAAAVLGEDVNDNGRLDAAENDGNDNWPDDNGDGKLDKGIKDCLTVFTDGKVNINTASPEVLLSLPGMNADILRDMTAMREVDPLTSLDEIKDLPSVDAAAFARIAPWAAVRTQWYRIRVAARTEEAGRWAAVLAVADRSGKEMIVRYWREGQYWERVPSRRARSRLDRNVHRLNGRKNTVKRQSAPISVFSCSREYPRNTASSIPLTA